MAQRACLVDLWTSSRAHIWMSSGPSRSISSLLLHHLETLLIDVGLHCR